VSITLHYSNLLSLAASTRFMLLTSNKQSSQSTFAIFGRVSDILDKTHLHCIKGTFSKWASAGGGVKRACPHHGNFG